MTPKPVDVVSTEDCKEKVSDIQVVGDPDIWQLVCKVSSKSQNWSKSTKAMEVPTGVVLQVTTQVGKQIFESLLFVPEISVADLGRIQ